MTHHHRDGLDFARSEHPAGHRYVNCGGGLRIALAFTMLARRSRRYRDMAMIVGG